MIERVSCESFKNFVFLGGGVYVRMIIAFNLIVEHKLLFDSTALWYIVI